MSDRTRIIWSERSALHDMGSHPENQRRLDAIRDRLSSEGRLDSHSVVTPAPASDEDLSMVHPDAYVEWIKSIAERGGGAIDADTWVATGSFVAATHAAGAAIRAVDDVMTGAASRAFAMARPPGHHAERSRAMGFCLFNNIAIAAQAARSRHGVERVAIVDWDVHHGNGTQEIFYDRSDVLFVSVHQWPLYPGTGLAAETGVGDGEGCTLNIPLSAGATDGDYIEAFDSSIYPRISAFQPDLLMVSAGFDGHRDDPLAMMALTEHGFRELASRVRAWADELTQGRAILVLEGGYNLDALAASVIATLDGLDQDGAE